jgi:hypothetical protein
MTLTDSGNTAERVEVRETGRSHGEAESIENSLMIKGRIIAGMHEHS